ncbi:MAG: hydrogenase maturation protease [Candidatus Stygibacter frigidus]|nr:hydrogenase maturation protease [Candidatus Stygibacter frigidus]
MFDSFKPLLDAGNKKILFVGVGNRLKSDDAIGILICEKLKNGSFLETLIVEAAIEKFVGKINSLSPDLLVLVDCTDFNREPGYFKLIHISELPDNTFHTHTVSLRRISEFFEMETYLLGIQPSNVKFGEIISPPVQEAARKIIQYINSNI